jgi:hypothetical protein
MNGRRGSKATPIGMPQARRHGTTAAQCNFAAMEQQLNYYYQQKSYQQVIAPFDGVITQRNIDGGSLITAEPTGGTSMFAVTHSDVIRVRFMCRRMTPLASSQASRRSFACPRCPTLPFMAKWRGSPMRCSRGRGPC